MNCLFSSCNARTNETSVNRLCRTFFERAARRMKQRVRDILVSGFIGDLAGMTDTVFRSTMLQNFATLFFASLSYIVDQHNARLKSYSFYQWAREAIQVGGVLLLTAMFHFLGQRKGKKKSARALAPRSGVPSEYHEYFEYGARAKIARSHLLPQIAIGG